MEVSFILTNFYIHKLAFIYLLADRYIFVSRQIYKQFHSHIHPNESKQKKDEDYTAKS